MWKGRFADLWKAFEEFHRTRIVANEALYYQQLADIRSKGQQWEIVPPISAQLKSEAQALGLWSLFLPSVSGVTQSEYAKLAEMMGRVPCFVDVYNCDAPDTGNMETLHMYGSEAQQRRWLQPLLNGEIRSAFCMTEPAVASSDASNIQCDAVEEAGRWKINGRKWWSTGAGHPRCELFVVMVRTTPNSSNKRSQQHTMLLVPRQTPGVSVGRPLQVFGDDDAPKGHFEVSFCDVYVDIADSTLLGPGRGFEIAQGRLGPGRVHHCMRAIGMAERALELMVARALERKAFGTRLALNGVVQQQIALCRVEIDQARLLVELCARTIDREDAQISAHAGPSTGGSHPIRKKSLRLLQLIAAIKSVVPRVACAVIDRSIQVHGGLGLCQDSILWRLYIGQRSLRIADGPDEVHDMSVAKLELQRRLKAAL